MRFVTLSLEPQHSTVGVLIDNDKSYIDLSHSSYQDLFDGRVPSLLSLIEVGLPRTMRALRERDIDEGSVRPFDWQYARLPFEPGKIIGVAFNYKSGLQQSNQRFPESPVIFFRSGSTAIGPWDPVRLPADVGHVTYEAEIAVVIGERALCVPSDAAMQYVAGYMAHNDVSGSALVKADQGNFVRGKNILTTAPLGPCLVARDALPDPHSVTIQLDVDGRVLQDGCTDDMLFNIPQLISYISHQYPLEAGDVIATGTPAGVAAHHHPAAWLSAGQTVRVTIPEIGQLSNPIMEVSNTDD